MSSSNKRSRKVISSAETAEPSNKRPRKSSESEAAQSTPLYRLNGLLADAVKVAQEVRPTREDGPAIKKAHRLAKSLLKTLPVEVAVKSIDYDAHKVFFEKTLKELRQDVAVNWKHGYFEHAEMEAAMAKRIMKWSSTIWNEMAVEGTDLQPVQQALVLCSSTVQNIEKINSRNDFDDELFEVDISRGDDDIYGGERRIHTVLAWMWKELFVYTTIQNKPTKTIVSAIQRFKLTKKVLSLIRQPGDDQPPDDSDFRDGHWTTAMQNAVIELRRELSEA